MNNTKVFIMMTCDEFKSTQSMHLIGVATNFAKVKESLKLLLQEDVIELDDDVRIEDIHTLSDIDNYVTYIFVDEIELDEIITSGGFYI